MTDRYLFSEVLQFGRILGQLIICIKLHLLSREGVSIEQKLPHELHPVSGPEITIGIEGMLEFFDLSNGPTCTVSHQLSQLHQLRYLIYIRLRNNRHGQTWSDSHVIKNRFKSLQKSPDGLSDDRLYWQNQSFRDELQQFINQWFPTTFLEAPGPNTAHFASLLCLTHPIQVLESLLMSWWSESGVFDWGDMENMQCCGASGNMVGNHRSK